MPEIAARPGVPRRRVLTLGAATAGAVALGPLAGAWAAPPRRGDPFSLGVASGDPTHDSVVLWTRLAPEPLTPDGGMPPTARPVQWEVAIDPGMRKVVCRGEELATPQLGHSVHAEPRGLRPGREYWYRFRSGAYLSEVGRTKTLPAPDSSPSGLLLGVASCQHFQTGYYTAYRYLVADHPDLVLFLGDYIYEYPPLNQDDLGPGGQDDPRDRDGDRARFQIIEPRLHVNGVPTDVGAFRIRYGQYKADPDLRAAHAAAPFVCTWDDHEVSNDWAGDVPQPADLPNFRRLKAAAFQTYYEHLPIRRPGNFGDWRHLRVHRRFTIGNLARISVLDTRSHRDDQPCDDGTGEGNLSVDDTCAERVEPGRTILGDEQRRWLEDGLTGSPARWNLVAQQCLFAEVDHEPGSRRLVEVDAWDGYPAERRALLEHVRDAQVGNVVLFSGDLHSHMVNDLRPDFRDPDSPAVANEFVGAAISSPSHDDLRALMPENPHIRYASGRNGYLRVRVGRDELRTDLRSLSGRADLGPGTRCATEASYVVEDGRPGAQRA